ncbi:alpha-ribazole phosphatase [Chitinophaga polysaccharea]|uniref:Alpha-ribazole phosphatase n=1 Tax=Chitinophaga polysaccharea TaxID=1293035 RepID=A0A561PB03_9BACT|nr:alpha-ribazole phosphatase [Chitinophaga polysaccharea]TWF35311.1 alpha-ribazole phosphatase [Chitinophaga polysaccharea]
MEIYLIRHTETILPKGICYGQTDVSLQEPFLDQFSKIISHVSPSNALVYSSPLKRCALLADAFSSYNGQYSQVITDNRLMEINFGSWEMKQWDEISQQELNKWMADFVNEKPLGGECFRDMDQRVKGFFDEKIFSGTEENNTIVIVTHAGVIRSILCQVLEIPLQNAFSIQIDYGSITKIRIDKKSCFQSIGYINQVVR